VPRALAFLAAALLTACGARDLTVVHFPPSDETLLNPERGFHVDIDLVKGRDFRYVREQGFTLGYALVLLDRHRFEALPQSLKDDLAAGFEAAREAGIKVVLRFAYNRSARGEDAPKWAILAHIQQLAPVLQANADVIVVLEAGFIGAWGEWHSSTWRLDNQRDRGDVLWALLTALPPSRATMVRSPVYKVLAYGKPLEAEQAFSGTHQARVGHLNSCFLASDSDVGTWIPPIDDWKAYVAQEGRFTPVGGETCALNPPRSDCETAEKELRWMHWSFLNTLYHPGVIEAWKRDGCFPTIGRDLGYRLEVEALELDPAVAPGGVLRVVVRLRNTGYAAMFNARPVFLTVGEERVQLPDDPRRWEPGEAITVETRVRVPATLPPGAHRLGLWLPDADERLRTPPRVANYSIRLANTRWDAPVNVLTDRLIVDRAARGDIDRRATRLALSP
jgi:Domain of unknown function (DUF4832)/Domain of unknown function (DUF4874)